MMDEAEIVKRIEEASALLEDGRPREALVLLADLDDDDPDRRLLELDAWTGLADWSRAEDALIEAYRTNEAGEPYVALYEGRLRLAQWRTDAARACFTAVPLEVGGASLLESMALLEDLAGNPDVADGYLAQAADLEPEGFFPPVRLSASEFEELVEQAAEELPDNFREALATVAVVIDPMPTAALVEAPHSGYPPDVLGLFAGLPLHEREARGHGEMPATIFLFQRNLERISPDREALCEEVRITLYHELGHALGFDEDGVDGMGLG